MKTQKQADDCMKLLDSGYTIMIRKGELGSYEALAIKQGQTIRSATECLNQITDDFTPSQALYRLTEKVTTGRIA